MVKVKKVLSIVVALMLLCNVFTVLSTAAVADNYAVAMAVSTDKTSYAAGETAVVSVYIEGSSRGGYDLTKISCANIAFGWDNTVLGISAEDRAVALTGAGMDVDVANSGIKSHSTDIDASEAAYGWNEIMNYGLILNSTATCASIDEVAFTVDIEIAEDAAPGDYYFGISSYYMSNIDDSYAFALTAEEMGDGIYGNCYEGDLGVDTIYDLTNAVAKITVGAATADPEVTHAKTMGQMADWTDTTATTFNAGFVGKISNLDVEFDANDDECTTIESIVVEITRGDVTLTGNAYQLYAQADGSYLFRAVVKNAAISDTEAISYKYIVTLADGSELTYESTEDTSFNAIYNTAKANYDAANA